MCADFSPDRIADVEPDRPLIAARRLGDLKSEIGKPGLDSVHLDQLRDRDLAGPAAAGTGPGQPIASTDEIAQDVRARDRHHVFFCFNTGSVFTNSAMCSKL